MFWSEVQWNEQTFSIIFFPSLPSIWKQYFLYLFEQHLLVRCLVDRFLLSQVLDLKELESNVLLAGQSLPKYKLPPSTFQGQFKKGGLDYFSNRVFLKYYFNIRNTSIKQVTRRVNRTEFFFLFLELAYFPHGIKNIKL